MHIPSRWSADWLQVLDYNQSKKTNPTKAYRKSPTYRVCRKLMKSWELYLSVKLPFGGQWKNYPGACCRNKHRFTLGEWRISVILLCQISWLDDSRSSLRQGLPDPLERVANRGSMDGLELTIHGTGYPRPGGYDELTYNLTK